MNRNRNRNRNRARRTRERTPEPVDLLAPVRAKFARLSEVRAQLEQMKGLYREHDELLEDLQQYFIERTESGWVIKDQFILGTKAYRLVPSFFSSSKNRVVAKSWKSSASSAFTIEG